MGEPDPSEVDMTDRDDVLWVLESHDIALPDGLTIEKIRDRGAWWRIDDDGFSFRIERHPSPFLSLSMTEGHGPTPARWHIRTRYRYDLRANEWEVTELSREFVFDPGLLIDHVFERGATRDHWAAAIERVRTADNPDAAFEQEYAQMADAYQEQFAEIPDDHRDEMLAVLKQEFRRRVNLE